MHNFNLSWKSYFFGLFCKRNVNNSLQNICDQHLNFAQRHKYRRRQQTHTCTQVPDEARNTYLVLDELNEK